MGINIIYQTINPYENLEPNKKNFIINRVLSCIAARYFLDKLGNTNDEENLEAAYKDYRGCLEYFQESLIKYTALYVDIAIIDVCISAFTISTFIPQPGNEQSSQKDMLTSELVKYLQIYFVHNALGVQISSSLDNKLKKFSYLLRDKLNSVLYETRLVAEKGYTSREDNGLIKVLDNTGKAIAVSAGQWYWRVLGLGVTDLLSKAVNKTSDIISELLKSELPETTKKYNITAVTEVVINRIAARFYPQISLLSGGNDGISDGVSQLIDYFVERFKKGETTNIQKYFEAFWYNLKFLFGTAQTTVVPTPERLLFYILVSPHNLSSHDNELNMEDPITHQSSDFCLTGNKLLSKTGIIIKTTGERYIPTEGSLHETLGWQVHITNAEIVDKSNKLREGYKKWEERVRAPISAEKREPNLSRAMVGGS